ncbi:MAG TPA: zinc ABC transporter substrate-binding protein [Acidothermaceae bacterium]|jgi:zinc/manganese transport system substrate-binding protein
MRLAVSCFAGLGLLLTACSSTPATTAASPAGIVRVVAAENFWGDIAAQIGGTHVAVTSIITDPNVDPHTHESNPHDAAALSSAQLVIENGFGYDDFIAKLLSAGHKSGRTVLSIEKVLAIGGTNPNPHVWYDTAKLPAVAEAIRGALANADPADAATFAANAKTFDDSLAPLLNTIAHIKTAYAGAKVAYTERVPGYLVAAAGLVVGSPTGFAQAIEDGNDPSPRDTAAFETAITDHQVKVLLYNSQVTDAQTDRIKQLARDAGVLTVGVAETIPKTDANFQAWQLRQDNELLAALGG